MHPYPELMVARPESRTVSIATDPPTDDEPGAVVRLVHDGAVPRASCPHCGGVLKLSTVGSTWQVHSPADVGDRLVLQLGMLEREELHVLALNTRNVVVDQQRLYQGNVSSTLVRVGELFRRAVEVHASSIILCHNHPSGDPTPSPDDLRLTAEAIAAGRLLDITLLDHVIVAGASYASLRDRGVEFGNTGDHRAGERPGPSRGEPHPRRDRLRLHVEDGQVRDDAGRVYDVREAAHALPWQTALASSGSPHQYCVLRKSHIEAWVVLATAIALHPDAYMAYHLGYQKPMRYWELEGWRYWRTSAGGGRSVTAMLNRCRLDSDTPRRVDDGAVPIPWKGPPWLGRGSPWPPGWIKSSGPGPRHGEYVYRVELDTRKNYRCHVCGRKFYWYASRPCPWCRTVASEEQP